MKFLTYMNLNTYLRDVWLVKPDSLKDLGEEPMLGRCEITGKRGQVRLYEASLQGGGTIEFEAGEWIISKLRGAA